MTTQYLHLRLPAPPASADGRAYFFSPDVGPPTVADVVFFVDYENMRRSLNGVYGEASDEFDPIKLAQLVLDRRLGPSRLKELRIYRGIPNRTIERNKSKKDGRQRRRWLGDPATVFIGRPMQYRRGSRVGREKGIDIALAIDAIVHAFRHRADCIVICSRDSDLEPVIEFLLTGLAQPVCVEVVGIRGLSRLKFRRTEEPWCHFLTKEDFEAIRDDEV